VPTHHDAQLIHAHVKGFLILPFTRRHAVSVSFEPLHSFLRSNPSAEASSRIDVIRAQPRRPAPVHSQSDIYLPFGAQRAGQDRFCAHPKPILYFPLDGDRPKSVTHSTPPRSVLAVHIAPADFSCLLGLRTLLRIVTISIIGGVLTDIPPILQYLSPLLL
jgi:hypothetical protein